MGGLATEKLKVLLTWPGRNIDINLLPHAASLSGEN